MAHETDGGTMRAAVVAVALAFNLEQLPYSTWLQHDAPASPVSVETKSPMAGPGRRLIRDLGHTMPV